MHEITGSKNRNYTKNSNPLPLMSKGEEEQANTEIVLPSTPKGETVGNIVIDGKEGKEQQQGICIAKVEA